MQWDSPEFGGFSTATPWLAMGEDRQGIDVDVKEYDPHSVLNFYRTLVQTRKDLGDLPAHGSLEAIDSVPDNVVVYRWVLPGAEGEAPQVITVLMNMSGQEAHIPLQDTGLNRSSSAVLLDSHVQQKGPRVLI